jgi:hypothetical protein
MLQISILNRSPQNFHSVVETLQPIFIYRSDLPVDLSELEGTVSLERTAKDCKIPGVLHWHVTFCYSSSSQAPSYPPPLSVIEEIENGLDPNSAQLIVDEVQRAVENGKTQIILTTHFPDLLDKLSPD